MEIGIFFSLLVTCLWNLISSVNIFGALVVVEVFLLPRPSSAPCMCIYLSALSGFVHDSEQKQWHMIGKESTVRLPSVLKLLLEMEVLHETFFGIYSSVHKLRSHYIWMHFKKHIHFSMHSWTKLRNIFPPFSDFDINSFTLFSVLWRCCKALMWSPLEKFCGFKISIIQCTMQNRLWNRCVFLFTLCSGIIKLH